MKTSIGLLVVLGLSAVAAPLGANPAGDRLRMSPEPRPGEPRSERRVIFGETIRPGEKEKVAFLGVETGHVSAALAAQLGLQKDTGLVVRHVVPESPAAGVLAEHDVLVKFGDQILIDPWQFSVLVRNHQEGDAVEIAYLRGGKTAKATVKLGSHEVPKRMAFGFGVEPEAVNMLMPAPEGTAPRQEVRRVLSTLGRPVEGDRLMRLPPGKGPAFHALTTNPGNSNMVYTDETGSLELTIKDGKKSLLAKNSAGEKIFDGPVDTPKQREALPAELREKLERIEGMREFSFEVGDEFSEGERIPRPIRQKISMPLPAEPGVRELRAGGPAI